MSDNPADSNIDTLFNSVVTVYPIHIDCEEEWWQHKPFRSPTLTIINGCDLTPTTLFNAFVGRSKTTLRCADVTSFQRKILACWIRCVTNIFTRCRRVLTNHPGTSYLPHDYHKTNALWELQMSLRTRGRCNLPRGFVEELRFSNVRP